MNKRGKRPPGTVPTLMPVPVVLLAFDWFAYYLAPIATALAARLSVQALGRSDGKELGSSTGGEQIKRTLFEPVPVAFLTGGPLALRALPSLVTAIRRSRSNGVNIVHAQFHSDWRLVVAGILSGAKVRLLTVHDVTPHPGTQSNDGHRVKRLIRRRLYRSSTGFIVHGEPLARDLRLHPWVRPSQAIYVIPHGVLAHPSGVSPLPGSRTVLFFGNAEFYKGLDILVGAAEKARIAIPDLKVVVAAHGPELKRARASEQTDGLFEWREGFVSDSDIPALFAGIDVVVLPYREASQSGVIPLAFSNGRPVIASRVGALAEAVADEVDGLLVEPESSDALSAAIVRVFSEPGLLDLLARNATSVATSGRLSAASIAARHEAVYVEELTRHVSPGHDEGLRRAP